MAEYTLSYTVDEINERLGEIENLAKKSELPKVPTNVSAFTNDAGYLTEHQSLANYATKSEVEDLKTSVSEGKALIASAVTDKGVQTADNDTFAVMAANIRLIDGGNNSGGSDVFVNPDYVYYPQHSYGNGDDYITEMGPLSISVSPNQDTYIDTGVYSESQFVIVGFFQSNAYSMPEGGVVNEYGQGFVLTNIGQTKGFSFSNGSVYHGGTIEVVDYNNTIQLKLSTTESSNFNAGLFYLAAELEI